MNCITSFNKEVCMALKFNLLQSQWWKLSISLTSLLLILFIQPVFAQSATEDFETGFDPDSHPNQPFDKVGDAFFFRIDFNGHDDSTTSKWSRVDCNGFIRKIRTTGCGLYLFNWCFQG